MKVHPDEKPSVFQEHFFCVFYISLQISADISLND